MTENTKPLIGRPSKGPRHSFVVKLDLDRAAKLMTILQARNINGVDYLTPIVEAHVDSIDLEHLRNDAHAGLPAAAGNSAAEGTSPVRRGKSSQEERLRRAQILSHKINLLLDVLVDDSGRPYDYPVIRAGAEQAGFIISRTRWSLLKNGQVQVVPDACLRAIATVFGMPPDYLLDENASLPPRVDAALPDVRIKRLSEVREFADRALRWVDPERLKAVTRVLDEDS